MRPKAEWGTDSEPIRARGIIVKYSTPASLNVYYCGASLTPEFYLRIETRIEADLRFYKVMPPGGYSLKSIREGVPSFRL